MVRYLVIGGVTPTGPGQVCSVINLDAITLFEVQQRPRMHRVAMAIS
jgi:hypothetical protein